MEAESKALELVGFRGNWFLVLDPLAVFQPHRLRLELNQLSEPSPQVFTFRTSMFLARHSIHTFTPFNNSDHVHPRIRASQQKMPPIHKAWTNPHLVPMCFNDFPALHPSFYRQGATTTKSLLVHIRRCWVSKPQATKIQFLEATGGNWSGHCRCHRLVDGETW